MLYYQNPKTPKPQKDEKTHFIDKTVFIFTYAIISNRKIENKVLIG